MSGIVTSLDDERTFKRRYNEIRASFTELQIAKKPYAVVKYVVRTSVGYHRRCRHTLLATHLVAIDGNS
jgi:hypothetical protein